MTSSGSTLSPLAMSAADIVRTHRKPEVLPEVLEKKLGMDRWQAVLILKELADAGYGTYIVGRRGGETRLEKAASLPDGGSAGLTASTSVGGLEASTRHVFQLMRESPVGIEVPADLTLQEAEKISKWLRAIAIDAPID